MLPRTAALHVDLPYGASFVTTKLANAHCVQLGFVNAEMPLDWPEINVTNSEWV